MQHLSLISCFTAIKKLSFSQSVKIIFSPKPRRQGCPPSILAVIDLILSCVTTRPYGLPKEQYTK